MEQYQGIYNSEHYTSPTEMQGINNIANREKAEITAKRPSLLLRAVKNMCAASGFTLDEIHVTDSRTGKHHHFNRAWKTEK